MKKQLLQIYLLILASILTYWAIFNFNFILEALGFIVAILKPFIVGLVLTYLISPIYNKVFKLLKGKKFAKSVAIFTCILTVLAIATILSALIIPGFINSIKQIISSVSRYSSNLTALLNNRDIFNEYLEQAFDYIKDYLVSFFETATVNVGNTIITLLSSTVTTLKDSVFGFIIMIYLLSEKDTLAKGADELLKLSFDKRYNKVKEYLTFADKMFNGFLRGKLLDSLIIGVICFIIMTILKMPYTLLISVIIGITNIIPFFGPFIGAIPSALLLLVEKPMLSITFIIIIIILQQFDGNLLGPLILGDSTGVSPFWVLFSILVFGKLFGIVGMVIGVPLFAVIQKIFTDYITQVKEKRELTDVN